MLTPAQIRSHRFTSAVRGSYKAEEVDTFVEEVAASYEQAFRENAELIKKIGVLAQKVEEYRDEEDNIKATLLTAQRVADEMTGDAQEKSAKMLQSATDKLEYAESSSKVKAQIVIDEANKISRDKIFEAEIKANQTLADAAKKAEELLAESKRESVEQLKKINGDIQKESLCLEILKKEAASFKEELKEKYRQHLEFIEELPVVVAQTISPGISVDDDDHEEPVEASVDDASVDDAELSESVEEEESEVLLESETDDDEEEFFNKQDEIDCEAEPVQDVNDEDALEDMNESDSEEVPVTEDSKIQQKGIDDAIDEINDFLSESEEQVAENIIDEEEPQSDFSDNVSEEESNTPLEAQGTDESDEEEQDYEKVEDSEDADEGDEEGLPNLFSLRKMAMAQQQELSAADTEAVSDSLDEINTEQNDEILEITQTNEDEEEENDTNDDGFKVYLENLDADDDILSGDSDEDLSKENSLFETVEYDDDDDDDEDDDSKEDGQPRFKGFFKK